MRCGYIKDEGMLLCGHVIELNTTLSHLFFGMSIAII